MESSYSIKFCTLYSVKSCLIVVMKWNRDVDHRSVALSYFLHGAYAMLDKLEIVVTLFSVAVAV